MELLLGTLIALAYFAAGLSMLWVVRIAPPGAPLGVRVPEAKQDHPLIDQQWGKYKRNGLIIAVVTSVLGFVSLNSLVLTLLVPIVQIAAFIWNYVSSRAPLAEVKIREGWFDGVPTRISAEVVKDTYPGMLSLPTATAAWLMYTVSAVILVPPVILIAMRWERIPDVIPTHWGSGMEPDAWGEKSVGLVFVPTWIALGCLVLFCTMSWFMFNHEPNLRTSRGPASLLRNKASMVLTAVGLSGLCLALCLGLVFMQYASYTPGAEHLVGASFITMLILSIGGAIALCVYAMRGIAKVDNQIRQAGIADGNESPDNDQYYKWGMFYYNPQDPAVLVDKRFGVGVDFNYATWQGKLFVVVTVIVCIAPFGLIFV